jgi:hypothetical protein
MCKDKNKTTASILLPNVLYVIDSEKVEEAVAADLLIEDPPESDEEDDSESA